MTKDEWDKSRKSPIQLESGDFWCPDCIIPLVSGKVEMYYKQEQLGYFDGLKCKICNYGLLTEQGYIDSGNVIKYGTQSSSNEIVNLSKFGESTNDVSNLQMFITNGAV